MSKLDDLFESKPMQALQRLGGAMQSNKTISAMTGGLMGTMGLILCGAVFTIIAALGNLVGLIPADSAVYAWLNVPYNMTMNLMGIAVAFMVGYNYAKVLELKGPIIDGIVTMVLFLMVAAPMQTVTLADGATTMTVLDTSFLGGTGLFPAMIIPLVSVRIIAVCEKKNITIRMPDSVPPFLQESFSSLIPLVINVLLWHGLNTVLQSVMGVTLPAAIIGILSIPINALVSVPGMFVIGLFCMILWSFGIHGTMVVYAVIMVPMITAVTTNASLYEAGQPTLFHATMLFAAISSCGGTGNVLPLAIQCMRCKSQQLRSVGKAGLIPAIFNISEPLAFGVPIMYNPLIAIPFILNPLISMAILLVLFQTGIILPTRILMMTVLPVGLQNYLGNMELSSFLITVIVFIVAWLCYLPFVKAYDKQLLAQEAAQSEE